jgi:hypothetical protein
MTRRIDVYGHRATDGFVFASYPEHEHVETFTLPVDSVKSPMQWVETKMMDAFCSGTSSTEEASTGDSQESTECDVFGPTPSDANVAERQRALDSPIPLEEDRDSNVLYKVGELIVTDEDSIVSFDPLDVDEIHAVETGDSE